MKRAIFSIVLLACAAGSLISCGGGSSSSSSTTTSGVKKRAFVSNAFMGSVDIIDYTKDLQSGSSIALGTSPEEMALSKDHTLTLVVDSGTNNVSVVTNASETVTATFSLPNWTKSLAISPDSKVAWAAVRNSAVANAQTGTVEVMDLTTTGTLGTAVPVPLARYLFLNHAGTTMIALGDPVTPVATPLTVLDVSTPLTPVVKTTLPAGTNLDRPAWVVFSSDDSKAYIVNCGPECGGSQASVSVLDMASGQITANYAGDGTHPFAGSVAAMDSSNTLYVAGTPPGYVGTDGVSRGLLWALSTSGGALALSKGPVEIGDGFHTTATLASDNKLFVGANPCSNLTTTGGPAQGCLTIYDTGSGSAVVGQAKGFVTGMDPVPGRNVVYVIEGGELVIYDTTTSAVFTQRSIDIFGQAYDVKIIDQ